MKLLPRLFTSIVIVCGASIPACAQEDPADLVKARASYERDIEVLTKPVNDRYLRLLEQMKRTLGGRGDIHGALAVQKEIERVDPAAALKAFAGKWKVIYSNGDTQFFFIDATGGVVKTPDENQKSAGKRTKLTPMNGDFIMDWKVDDRIERVVVTSAGLQLDHFARNLYPHGAPGLKATGTLVGASR